MLWRREKCVDPGGNNEPRFLDCLDRSLDTVASELPGSIIGLRCIAVCSLTRSFNTLHSKPGTRRNTEPVPFSCYPRNPF